MKWLMSHLRNKILAGGLAAVPLVIVAYVLWFVEEKTKALAAPLGVHFTGFGFLIALVGIYLLGLLITSFLGRLILGLVNTVLEKIPGINLIYKAWKDVLVLPPNKTGMFHLVVMVRDTGRGWQLGFTSGEPLPNDPQCFCVLLPDIPSPFSGRLLVVPKEQCLILNMSVEEALKYQLSTGNFLPPGLMTKPAE